MDIVFDKAAKEDLADIHDYIAKDLSDSEVAKRIVRSLLRRIDILRDFPLSGPKLGDVSDRLTGYRLLVAGNYQIIYRATKSEVIITRVIYARMDYSRLF